VAAEGDAPVQMRVHKSLKLWSFYVDLEESLGTLDDTRKVYERILDLKIATPQIILNYTALLEVPLPSLANVANNISSF
jgi:pre-mRNA-splicing factor SYF1